MNQLSTDSTSSLLPAVQHFFSQDVEAFKQALTLLESEIDQNATPQLNDEFHLRLREAFAQSQTACRNFEDSHSEDPELIKEVQARFRAETEPWFRQSWFANRARTKPSGFSGDYAMLLKLYEESTPARGIGGYLDLCLSELPLSQAVRGRMKLARKFLLDEIKSRTGHVRILDIACGPCREYLDWPSFSDQSVEVVTMDNDPIALEYVESQVAAQLPSSTKMKPVRYNALRTRNAEATKKHFGSFDIIYSVGLADYLTDDHLTGIFSGLGETLNEGGTLVIAFKDTEQYDETPYQWHLDWFFYQRTVEDVLKVYDLAGFNTDKMELTRDESGIITNFLSRRTPDMVRRLDPAHVPTGVRKKRAASVSAEPLDTALES